MIYKIHKSHAVKSFSKAKDIKTNLYWAPRKNSPRIELSRDEFIWEIQKIEKPPVLKWAVSFDEDTKDLSRYHVALFEWQLRYQNRYVN